MSFELRGIGKIGRITDAMKSRIAKWSVRSGRDRASIESLVQRIELGEKMQTLTHRPEWEHIRSYIQERKNVSAGALESSTVLSQDKALELASFQGRIKELRLLEEWIELQIKRGVEASEELAKRKEK